MRIYKTSLWLPLVCAATAGCGEPLAGEDGTNEAQGAVAASSDNGLTGINGLNSFNGLSTYNGLTSYNGLMSTSDGRMVVSYLVRCALPAGHQITKQDQSGTW